MATAAPVAPVPPAPTSGMTAKSTPGSPEGGPAQVIPPAEGQTPQEEIAAQSAHAAPVEKGTGESFDPAHPGPGDPTTVGGLVFNQPEAEPKLTPGDVSRSTSGPEQATTVDMATVFGSGSMTAQALLGTSMVAGAAFQHPPDPSYSPFQDPDYKNNNQLLSVVYGAQSKGEADDLVTQYRVWGDKLIKLQDSSNAVFKAGSDFAGMIDWWGWMAAPEAEGIFSTALKAGAYSTLMQFPVEAIASATDPLRPDGALVSNMISNFNLMSIFGLVDGTLGKILGEGHSVNLLDRPEELPEGTAPGTQPPPGDPNLKSPDDHNAAISVQTHAADPLTGDKIEPVTFERLVAITKGAEDPSGDPMAISKAATPAMGTMQVIEATAREMAEKLGDHQVGAMNKEQLRSFLAETVPGETYTYSEKYGREYYREQLQKYGDPSLAWAAYNAGPAAADHWLKEFGDPRKGEISMDDWIKKIPYDETRDYVTKNTAAWRKGGGSPKPFDVAIPPTAPPTAVAPKVAPFDVATGTGGTAEVKPRSGPAPFDLPTAQTNLLSQADDLANRSAAALARVQREREALARLNDTRAPRMDEGEHVPPMGTTAAEAHLAGGDSRSYPISDITYLDADGQPVSQGRKADMLRVPGEEVPIDQLHLVDAKGKPVADTKAGPGRLEMRHDQVVLKDGRGKVTSDPRAAKSAILPSRSLPREHFDFTDAEGRPTEGPDRAAFAHLRAKPHAVEGKGFFDRYRSLINFGAREVASNLAEPVALGLEKRPTGNWAGAEELEARAAGAAPTPFGVAPGALAHRQAQGLFGQTMKKAWGMEKLRWNPILRAMNSGSLVMRDLMERLTVISGIMNKHLAGVAGRVSVWQKFKLAEGELNRLNRLTDEAYAVYRKRLGAPENPVGKTITMLHGQPGIMSKQAFFDAVGRAKRYGPDEAQRMGLPHEAIDVAHQWDQNIYKPWADRADKSEAFVRPLEDEMAAHQERLHSQVQAGDIVGAAETRGRMADIGRGLIKARDNARTTGTYKQAYLNRIYDQRALAADKPGFMRILDQYGVPRAEQENIYQTLIKAQPFQPYGPDNIGRASSLHQRALAFIPDKALDRYLEHDISIAGQAYTRQFVPDILLTEEFGDPNMREALDQVVADYNKKAAGASPTEQKRLEKSLQSDLRDLRSVRDQVRGTAGLPKDPQAWTSRAIRDLRNWNNATQLTGFVSALPDAMRPAMVYGVNRAFGGYLHILANSPSLLKLGKKEAELGGHAAEVMTALNSGIWGHVSDSFAGSNKVERTIQHIASARFAFDGMAHFQDHLKSVTSLIAGTSMLEAVGKWTKGTASAADIAKLAASYIDEPMAHRIQAMADQHGWHDGPVHFANYEAWGDQAAKETYQAALSREIDETIAGSTRPGERPIWMTTELGSLLGQYRSYGFTSLMRIMIPAAQQFDRKMLVGLVGMVGLGMLADMMLSHARGEDYQHKSWRTKIINALDRSGVLGSFMDINNTVEGLSSGMLGLRPALGAPTPGGLSRVAGAVGGPSISTFENLQRSFFGNPEDPQTQSARLRTIPLANTWHAHELLNMAAGRNGHDDNGPAVSYERGR
jgi:hypothetical protein